MKKNDGSSRSKQEVAYQYIKSAIIANELKPKSMLLEANLSERIGVSRTPIREALRRLSSEGLVEFIPDKGCFVSGVSFEEFIEIFDVREVLEGMAARLCAKRFHLMADQLEGVMESFRKYYGANDRENILKEDVSFHQILIEMSGNRRLALFLTTLHEQIDRIRVITMYDQERLDLSLVEHTAILDAIKRGDPDLAEETCRFHIRSIKEYLINKLFLVNNDLIMVKKQSFQTMDISRLAPRVM